MGRNNFLFYCILFLFLISFLFASVEIFLFFPTTENVYRFIKVQGFVISHEHHFSYDE